MFGLGIHPAAKLGEEVSTKWSTELRGEEAFMGAEGTIYAQFAFDEILSGRLRIEGGGALVSTCPLQVFPCFSLCYTRIPSCSAGFGVTENPSVASWRS